MNRALVVAALVVAGAAFAQERGGARWRAPAPQPQVIQSSVLGGPFVERVPRLRSWVTGWSLTGSRVEAYEVRCDEIANDCGVPILRTRAGASEPLGMGSLTHVESAEPWRGRRLKLTAELRTGRVDGWAGLWMRVDDAEGKPLAFDNMQNRALRGTTSYETYTVVLDVPAGAARLSFGVLLHGPGAVFIREVQFEEADEGLGVSDLLGPLQAARKP